MNASVFILHLPATLPGFAHWLAVHWPVAPHGCRFEYGHGPGQLSRWQEICRPSGYRARFRALMSAIVHGRSIGIDGRTYVARLVNH